MKKTCLALAGAAAWLATPAGALPIPGTGLDLNAEAVLMSDFRFRGISRSGSDPALQGNVSIGHDSGLYVGARATTLDGLDNFRFRDPQLDDLGDAQVELYAGFARDIGAGLSADAGVLYYAFPGGEGPREHFEPYASLSYLLGPVEATAGIRYAPAQDGTGDEPLTYVFGEVDASIPFTPFTLTGHVGRQDWGVYGSYTNWSVGGRYTLGPAELGLRYVDTNLPEGPGQNAGLVASVRVGF